MLILSRKKGQSIAINDNIEIFIVSIDGDQVKIGIEAPSEVKIYRKEVLDSILQSNKEALATPQQLKTIKGLTVGAIPKAKKIVQKE